MPADKDGKHDVHKYERIKLGHKGFEVFKCMKPNCAHYIRKELVVGRKTVCWRCGNDVIMTKPMAKQKKPHCRTCTRGYTKHDHTEEAA